jgi:hypothetical protein
MAINREDFKKITDGEFTQIRNTLRDNQQSAVQALAKSEGFNSDSDVCFTSDSFYISLLNAKINENDAKLKRKKRHLKGSFKFLLYPTLIIAAILFTYAFFSNANAVDKWNVAIFSGYLYFVFLFFIGSNVISELRDYRRFRNNYTPIGIFNRAIAAISKSAFALTNKGIIFVNSGENIRIPYSEIYSAAIVGEKAQTTISLNSRGVTEHVLITEPDISSSNYNELRIFMKNGKTYHFIEPEGHDGETGEDILQRILNKAAA